MGLPTASLRFAVESPTCLTLGSNKLIRQFQIIANILLMLLGSICILSIYFSHLDISETKNKQLQREMIEEINKFKNLEELRKDYISYLENVDNARKEHNSEFIVKIFLLVASIVLLFINYFLMRHLARKNNEAT